MQTKKHSTNKKDSENYTRSLFLIYKKTYKIWKIKKIEYNIIRLNIYIHYNIQMEIDTTYLEIKNKFKKNSNKQYDKYLLPILLVILLSFVFHFIKWPYEYISDINNLPEPVQTPASGWFEIIVNWEIIYIDLLAEYDIVWQVLAKKSYSEVFWNNKIINKLWPRDFVLWRWELSKQENLDKFIWSEYIDRSVQPHIKREYANWFTKTFWWGIWSDPIKFKTSFSNNHPISDSLRTRTLLKKVRVWDVIRIKWYLIYVHSKNGWRYRWPSSLVRDDHWCEIIYVTDIHRIKQKIK